MPVLRNLPNALLLASGGNKEKERNSEGSDGEEPEACTSVQSVCIHYCGQIPINNSVTTFVYQNSLKYLFVKTFVIFVMKL